MALILWLFCNLSGQCKSLSSCRHDCRVVWNFELTDSFWQEFLLPDNYFKRFHFSVKSSNQIKSRVKLNAELSWVSTQQNSLCYVCRPQTGMRGWVIFEWFFPLKEIKQHNFNACWKLNYFLIRFFGMKRVRSLHIQVKITNNIATL